MPRTQKKGTSNQASPLQRVKIGNLEYSFCLNARVIRSNKLLVYYVLKTKSCCTYLKQAFT